MKAFSITIPFVILVFGFLRLTEGQIGENFPNSFSSFANAYRKENEFGYQIYDEKGNWHFQAEERTNTGALRGCYGYLHINGLYRVVEYTADDKGYRTKIYSKEPGIHKTNPAHVVMDVVSPVYLLKYSPIHPCIFPANSGGLSGFSGIGPTAKDKNQGNTDQSGEDNFLTPDGLCSCATNEVPRTFNSGNSQPAHDVGGVSVLSKDGGQPASFGEDGSSLPSPCFCGSNGNADKETNEVLGIGVARKENRK